MINRRMMFLKIENKLNFLWRWTTLFVILTIRASYLVPKPDKICMTNSSSIIIWNDQHIVHFEKIFNN